MLKTVSSITNSIGALNFKGTWNANANTPTLASGVGTKGDYYVVGTAGTTTLDGISNWGIGDWATYNGSVWQRVEGGADLNGVNLTATGTVNFTGATVSDGGSVTTVDINGGTIDGTTQASGTINGPIAAGGTWTAAATWTLPAHTLAGTVTSNNQSFSGTIANLGTVTTVDINGGTLDGTVIGGAARAAASTTTLDASSNVTLSTNGSYVRVKTGATNFDINANAGANDFMAIATNSTQRFQFNVLGAAYNTTGTWGTISDARLKENVIDATPKLNALMQLRVVNYNLKADPNIKQVGFIAQEVEQIFPGLVENGAPTEDGDFYKALKTSVLIPMLVKAMQEQQAQIESLKSEIETIKGA